MFLGPIGPATVRWKVFNLEGGSPIYSFGGRYRNGNLIYSFAGPNSSGGFASGPKVLRRICWEELSKGAVVLLTLLLGGMEIMILP